MNKEKNLELRICKEGKAYFAFCSQMDVAVHANTLEEAEKKLS